MTGLCTDTWIRERAVQGMIEPFEPKLISKNYNGTRCISYGLSSCGYDVRLAREFLAFDAFDIEAVDPKSPSPLRSMESQNRYLGTGETEYRIILPPNSYILGSTVEYFRIPEDCLCLCVGKSTYARCGLLVNTTPLEPGWEGHVTLELANATSRPLVLYVGEGIAQVLFFATAQRCETTYADRQGKYQAQRGVTPAKV